MKRIIEVIIAVAFIMGSIWIVQGLEQRYAFLDWRYKLHQKIHTYAAHMKGRPITDQNTIVVLIGDDEFWRGGYAGRTPVNKTNLAALISKIALLKPRVIALDFNFCSPTMDGSITEHQLYQDETKAFAQAVKAASTPECTIVLTKFLHAVSTPERGYWVALRNKFDDVQPDIREVASFGYINLPKDFRFIPLQVYLSDGTGVDSFAQAIVRSFDLTGDKLAIEANPANYCGGYLDQSKFVVHYSAEITNADEAQLAKLRSTFAGKVVIVGAGWSEYAAADPNDNYTPINTVDSRYGPAGNMPAVFLHANWVESILAERTGRMFPEHWRWVTEFGVGLLAFLIFRGWLPWLHGRKKVLKVLRVIYFPLVAALWILVCYLGFQNFGLFIDPLPVLVGALLALAERAVSKILKWRKWARQYGPAEA